MTSGTLEDLVSAIYPHLKGKAVIDGDPFDCPLPIHLDGDTRKMRLVSGKKRPKPYWKCEAGCCSDKGKGKHNDTLDFIRSALGIDYRKAITLWAKLAKAQPGERRAIVKSNYPKFYAEGLAE